MVRRSRTSIFSTRWHEFGGLQQRRAWCVSRSGRVPQAAAWLRLCTEATARAAHDRQPQCRHRCQWNRERRTAVGDATRGSRRGGAPCRRAGLYITFPPHFHLSSHRDALRAIRSVAPRPLCHRRTACGAGTEICFSRCTSQRRASACRCPAAQVCWSANHRCHHRARSDVAALSLR